MVGLELSVSVEEGLSGYIWSSLWDFGLGAAEGMGKWWRCGEGKGKEGIRSGAFLGSRKRAADVILPGLRCKCEVYDYCQYL